MNNQRLALPSKPAKTQKRADISPARRIAHLEVQSGTAMHLDVFDQAVEVGTLARGGVGQIDPSAAVEEVARELFYMAEDSVNAGLADKEDSLPDKRLR